MAARAEDDLRRKIRLERKLSAQMKRLFASIGRAIQPQLGSISGVMIPPITTTWKPVLVRMLMEHYAATTRTFAGGLSRAMPAELRPSAREREVMAIEMGRVFSRRADGQATLILDTAYRRIAPAVGRAAAAVAAPGSGLTSADLPAVAVRLWVRSQVVQARAVATVETQTAAETAKGIEAARLIGNPTPIHKASSEAWKVWQTQGDSRVRGADGKGNFDHFDADGQRVPVSGAFEVSGERLRWPGDWSLGASGGNIYGCRCSAIYEADSVAELRASVFERLVLDLQRFVQTASDVVVSLPFML